jgi:NitT/TauT family transport system permease protein
MEDSGRISSSANACLPEDTEVDGVCVAGYKDYSSAEKMGRKTLLAIFNVSNLRKILSLVGIVILWHIWTTYQIPPLSRVPTPYSVLLESIKYVPTEIFFNNVAFSMGRVFVGFVAACAIGIPLGLFMGWQRVVKDFAFPVFETLRPIPIISWIPLSVIMFPKTEQSIVFLVFLGAIYPIVLNTMLGVESVPRYYINGALSLGSTPRDLLRHVILPGALPSIFTGMTVGMGLTWVMVVAAEMVAGGYGLGYMTWESYILITYPRIILGMFAIGASGYLFSTIVRIIGTHLMPWRKLF